MEQHPSSDFYNFSLYHWETPTTWKVDDKALKCPVWVLLTKANERELTLLHKILAAVPLNVPQECSIIIEEGILQYKDLRVQATELQTLLVFGRKPHDLGLHVQIPAYQLRLFQKTQFLFADDLTTIAANQHTEKQQLWKQVQQLRST